MEFENWGWNAITISFIATMVMAAFTAWGLFYQLIAVWKNKSGLSVSVVWFSFGLGLYGVFALYGIELNSWALMLSGVSRGLLHLPILIGLWKFKGFSSFEKVLTVGVIASLVITGILPHRAWIFFVFSMVALVFVAAWPWEIYRNKDSGVVELKLICVYLANSVFWIIYGVAIGDWVLIVTSPLYTVVSLITVALCYIYRPAQNVDEAV